MKQRQIDLAPGDAWQAVTTSSFPMPRPERSLALQDHAQPGEPGRDTWNGYPLADRNGASVWVAGSYDAQLNLAFWGVAQTYDTGVVAHPRPGVNNDGLLHRIARWPEPGYRQARLVLPAIGVGNGGAQPITCPPLVPETQNTDEAAAIWVFEAL